ncbi:CNNM domain-containing protein [Thalassoglobus sp. JC818]|uniref:CNNM domain-containing protein n=1 Tax=Thalassoglobus sp. JC818 TaxID=3232136 RepID=UPI00345974C7
MPDWLEVILATLLLIVGLRLSAFFSGTETGFYRLSVPRLNIDSQTGDKAATTLLWFSRNPAYFVATCLIGNNVANYVTTAAIGFLSLAFMGAASERFEVLITILVSPIIFLFGELLPKSLYYLAPMYLLRKDVRYFKYIFRLLFVVTYPLVLLTRTIERLSHQSPQAVEFVLGRSRLVQLMRHGHEEGVLTDVQSRLSGGLLQLAPQPVTGSVTPAARILGVPETSTKAEILKFAHQFGISTVAVHRKDDPEDWYGYVVVSELMLQKRVRPIIHIMPVFDAKSSKLEVLHHLQCFQSHSGVIKQSGKTFGIVSRKGLIEQLYRPNVAASPSRSS